MAKKNEKTTTPAKPADKKAEAKPAAASKTAAKPASASAAAAAPAKPLTEAEKAKALAAKIAQQKAAKAGKLQKKGPAAVVKEKTKIRTSVHFHLPKTLRLQRNPKYERKSIPHRPRLDKYSILKHPLCTESAMKQIEENNTLTFIVDLRASKRHIQQAVKQLYEITAVKVNTVVRPDGTKKAYVRLSPDHEALEVANTIGII